MKVELSIKDDKELRETIKDMIRGQVMNIIRSETASIIATEVERKFKAGTFNYTIQAELFNRFPTSNTIRESVDKAIVAAVRGEIDQTITMKCLEMLDSMRDKIDAIVVASMNKARLVIKT